MQSFVLIRKLKPSVVVGTGGYVCGPPLFMAALLGIRTLIQEQNSFPGVTTRLLSPRADEVHITFERSIRYLKRTDNVRVSGNPTRAVVGSISRADGAKFFDIDPRKNTVLGFGGSLGAISINDTLLKGVRELVASGVQIVWQTGAIDYERINNEIASARLEATVKVHKFIERMEFAYAACDLAICRAGATTVAELTRAGVPSVLVPYPFAAADHQTANAMTMVDAGAAVMIPDSELNARLLATVQKLVGNTARLKNMSTRALSLAKPDASATLARAVLDLAKANHGRA
jgi:UDP-N-acetylglucosamine--N-acetylmuramyl-(pentapeptide) pyrophosphoryl-undecaprenol N-acetylglucosamine transferase